MALSSSAGATLLRVTLSFPCFHAGKFSCPCIVQWSEDTVLVSYTVWGAGLRLATIRLATAEA
jgi:hypothetical protein